MPLESERQTLASDQTHSTLLAVKFEYSNNFLEDEAEFTIHRTRGTYYNQSES